MLHLPTVKNNLWNYVDAGFPILYICTFEETKADRYIASVAGKREVVEWNGVKGYVNFKTKVPHFNNNYSLENTLSLCVNNRNELKRKLLVIKDADELLNADGQQKSSKVISLLKELARKIREGLDATIIIVSPTLHIPRDLEKMTTVLELELPNENEILEIINRFVSENEIEANTKLLSEMSMAFKGLTEYEIEDLLRLAVSQDGELTKKALQIIFEQKKQMILKAGILEMIPLKETIDDIGGLENLKEWLQKKAVVFKNIKKLWNLALQCQKVS